MLNQNKFKKAWLLMPLTLLLLVGALAAQTANKPARPAAAPRVDCSAATDADIVKEIQDKLKADPAFKDQLKQINVSSKNRIVTLNGWVKGDKAKLAVGKYARSAKCVKSVVNKLATRLKVGCSPGQKPCGDICIDEKADCNIMN